MVVCDMKDDCSTALIVGFYLYPHLSSIRTFYIYSVVAPGTSRLKFVHDAFTRIPEQIV